MPDASFLNIQSEFIVAQIVTRYLNETIRRYGLIWVGCPIQEKLETVVERKIVDLATNFELLHFPKLIQLGNWFLMEFNNLSYSDLRKMLLQEINGNAAVSKLETLLELLSWGGLQAVRGIARNNPPSLTLEIKELLVRLIREEFFDWWLYEGGWEPILGLNQCLKRGLEPIGVDEVDGDEIPLKRCSVETVEVMS